MRDWRPWGWDYLFLCEDLLQPFWMSSYYSPTFITCCLFTPCFLSLRPYHCWLLPKYCLWHDQHQDIMDSMYLLSAHDEWTCQSHCRFFVLFVFWNKPLFLVQMSLVAQHAGNMLFQVQLFTFITMNYFLVFFIWTWISVLPSQPSVTSHLCFLPWTCSCSMLMLMVGGLEWCEPSMWTSIFIVSWNDFIGQIMIVITNFFLPCCPTIIQCPYSPPQKCSLLPLHLDWLELCRLPQLTDNSVCTHLSLRKNAPLLFNAWPMLLLAGGGEFVKGYPAWFLIIGTDSLSLFG
jgi:hypothetical protein